METCHQQDPRPPDQNDEEVHGAGTIRYGPDWYGMGQSSVADPGSSAFLTPGYGSGTGKKYESGSATLTCGTVR